MMDQRVILACAVWVSTTRAGGGEQLGARGPDPAGPADDHREPAPERTINGNLYLIGAIGRLASPGSMAKW